MDEQSQSSEPTPVIQPQAESIRAPASVSPNAPHVPDTAPPVPGQMNIPPTKPLEVNQESFNSGEVGSFDTGTAMDSFMNSLKQVSHGDALGFIPGEPGSLLRRANEYLVESDSNAKPKLGVDEANAKAKSAGSSISFNEPTNPDIVDLRINEDKHQQFLKDWGDRLGSHPFLGFAAGLVGGFSPANIALGMVSGGLSEFAGVSAGLRSVFLQNLAINAATNTAGYYQEKREGTQPTIGDKALETVEGALGGTVFHYAVKGLVSAFGSGRDYLSKLSPDVREQVMKEAIVKEELGVKQSPSSYTPMIEARSRGDIEGGTSPYRFTPMEHPSDRAMYSAKNSNGANVFDHPLGPGTDLTDNAAYKNHQVSHPGGDAGQLGEHQLPPDGKYLDIDQSASVPGVKKFEAEIEEKLGGKLNIQEGETIKDVLTRLDGLVSTGEAPKDILSQIQEIAKQEGFEGYKHTLGEDLAGNKQNAVHLFDEKAMPNKIMDANPDVTPKLTPEQLRAKNAALDHPENGKYYDENQTQKIRELSHGKPTNSVPDEQFKINQESYQTARAQLDQRAKIDPTLASEIKIKLDRESLIDKQEKSALENLSNCLSGVS